MAFYLFPTVDENNEPKVGCKDKALRFIRSFHLSRAPIFFFSLAVFSSLLFFPSFFSDTSIYTFYAHTMIAYNYVLQTASKEFQQKRLRCHYNIYIYCVCVRVSDVFVYVYIYMLIV